MAIADVRRRKRWSIFWAVLFAVLGTWDVWLGKDDTGVFVWFDCILGIFMFCGCLLEARNASLGVKAEDVLTEQRDQQADKQES